MAAFVLVSSWLIAGTGCGSAPVQRDIVTAFAFPGYPVETVRAAVLQGLRDLDMAAEAASGPSAPIATGVVDLLGSENGSYCDCGKLGWATSWIARTRCGSFVVDVRDSLGTSTIIVHSQFAASFEADSGAKEKRECVSTGHLEILISRAVARRLRNPEIIAQ